MTGLAARSGLNAPPAALLPIAALLLLFLVFCFVELIRRPARYLPKLVWIVIILVQVPLGGICFLIFGRGEQVTGTPDRATPPPPAGEQGGVLPQGVPPSAVAPAQARPRHEPAAPDAVAVRTRALTKLFHGDVGLHAVDLAVPARGVYGLVGPNGAGKTTLLSLLAGLRRADTGEISTTARVTLCPDTPAFEPWLTAAETVEFFHDLASDGAARRDRSSGRAGTVDAARALALVGLADVRERRVGGFSRGMAQRLGLAVVLASGAETLLLDEPTSALDPQGRSDMLDLIKALGRDHAVVFSSHILADVQRVADTVGVLREGRLIYQGPVGELLDRHTRPSWRLQLRTGAPALAARLAGLEWVVTVERDAQGLRVDTTSLYAGETLLPAEIAASGAELIAFNPVGADLETVFLSMVDDVAEVGS